MTSVLRSLLDPSPTQAVEIEPESWDLDVQIAACTRWLVQNPLPMGPGELVLDIGFQMRAGVAVAGYTVPCAFMRLLCDRGIDLWLSHYPGECASAAGGGGARPATGPISDGAGATPGENHLE